METLATLQPYIIAVIAMFGLMFLKSAFAR